MIPKLIWQTYEVPFKELLPETKQCIQTWIDQNPTWKHMYMDAEERKNFVLHEFGEEWYELFSSCNLGIVQANIWRCMVVYTYGGVYCDLDTICNDSIESWIKEDFELILSEDDDANSSDPAIYIFAASPHNKTLFSILEKIKTNLKNNNIEINNVINLTGESVWSKFVNDDNVFIYKNKSNIFNGKAVTHLGTKKDWYKNGYHQWFRNIEHDS